MKNAVPGILIAALLFLTNVEPNEPEPQAEVVPLVAEKPAEHKPEPYEPPKEPEVKKEYQLWMFTMPGCQPCNRYKYVIDDYGLTYDFEGKSDVWLIDVVANPETMDDWDIDVLPTFMLVEKSDDTVIRRRVMGASSVPNARYMLEKHFPEILEGR